MLDQPVEFLKSAFIKQEVDSFTRRHLAGSVLLLDARGTAAFLRTLLSLSKLIELGKFRGLLFL